MNPNTPVTIFCTIAVGMALPAGATAQGRADQTRAQTFNVLESVGRPGPSEGTPRRLSGPAPVAAAPQPGSGYLTELALKPVASEDDLARIAARFAKLNPDWGTAGAQPSVEVLVGRLRDSKYLDSHDHLTPGKPLMRGQAAYLFARMLGLGGGVSGSLFALDRRIAYNELAEMRIVPTGGEHHRVSGAELIELADNAFAYQQHRKAHK